MRQLTYDEALAYVQKHGNTTFQIDRNSRIFIGKGMADIVFGLSEDHLSTYNRDTLIKQNFDFDYEWGLSWKNLYTGTFGLVEAEEEKQLQKVRHTYTTSRIRDDGVVFTMDTIDGKTIKELEAEEKQHYAEAKRIRALLNAHRNLNF